MKFFRKTESQNLHFRDFCIEKFFEKFRIPFDKLKKDFNFVLNQSFTHTMEKMETENKFRKNRLRLFKKEFKNDLINNKIKTKKNEIKVDINEEITILFEKIEEIKDEENKENKPDFHKNEQKEEEQKSDIGNYIDNHQEIKDEYFNKFEKKLKLKRRAIKINHSFFCSRTLSSHYQNFLVYFFAANKNISKFANEIINKELLLKLYEHLFEIGKKLLFNVKSIFFYQLFQI